VESPANQAQALAARAAARIRALQREADQLAARARSVFGDLRRLEIDRAIAREEVAKADAELTGVTASRDAAATRLEVLEATRVAETPGVAERLAEIYKRGRGGYLKMLLSAHDVRDFGRMSRGVAAVAELDRLRLEAHRRTLANERAAVAELERQRARVAESQRQAVRARAALDRAVAARSRLIDELDRRRDLAAQYVSELQAAQSALERQLAEGGATGAVPTLPIRPFRGDLDWPIAGRVTAPFGRAATERFGTAFVRNGLELAAPEGTPVRAIHEGTVAYAAPFTGFGVLVILDHGSGAFSLYGHLAESAVDVGNALKRGDVLGRVGLAPAGEASLYFELRIDGRPVDPLQWLRSSR
jgi:septal ring factor EnvC (AmiA/AmiB activator)